MSMQSEESTGQVQGLVIRRFL